MKAYSSCSGGVMFVEDEIERSTNKTVKTSKAKSYKDIIGKDADAKPLRDKIFGIFVRKKDASKAA